MARGAGGDRSRPRPVCRCSCQRRRKSSGTQVHCAAMKPETIEVEGGNGAERGRTWGCYRRPLKRGDASAGAARVPLPPLECHLYLCLCLFLCLLRRCLLRCSGGWSGLCPGYLSVPSVHRSGAASLQVLLGRGQYRRQWVSVGCRSADIIRSNIGQRLSQGNYQGEGESCTVVYLDPPGGWGSCCTTYTSTGTGTGTQSHSQSYANAHLQTGVTNCTASSLPATLTFYCFRTAPFMQH